MYGVVLWSDVNDKKAVIWCEDHGELAFYGGGSTSAFDGPPLDAGDLVHFEVTEGVPMRLAQNPELVAESHAPALVDSLRAAMHDAPGVGASVSSSAGELHSVEGAETHENVIPFKLACTA